MYVMQLFINSLAGNTITINCSSDDTIRDIKKYIESKEAIKIADQHLVYGGKSLQDQKKISDYYDLREYCTIHLSMRLRNKSDNVMIFS